MKLQTIFPFSIEIFVFQNVHLSKEEVKLISSHFTMLISAVLEAFKDISDGHIHGEEPSLNNTFKYIVMECKNDPTGGVPYWDPNYDHLISPFPECVTLRKYYILDSHQREQRCWQGILFL